LLAITVILFWKIALTSEFTWINSGDYVNQVVPWFQFQAKEWHAHRFPLWDPYHWCGQPFVGQTQPGAVYPLNWILFLLPLDHGRISIKYLNWYMVLVHFMAAVFAYLLCRELGCSKRASVLGGVAFAFSGYMGTTDWPQMINGVIWAPLVLLFFLRATRGHRPLLNSSLSGACAGVAFLSGHHQGPMFLMVFMSGLWLHAFFANGARFRKTAGMAALFFVFAFLIGAAQVLPSVEYGRIALRWVNAKDPVGWKEKVPYLIHERFSMNPVGVLGILIPELHVNFDPFLGPTIVALAIGAAIHCWANRLVRVLVVAGFAALLFSLGGFSPFQGVLYAVIPDLEKARSPSAAIFLFQLSAGALAAFGCDHLTSAAGERIGGENGWRKVAWGAWGFAALIYAILTAVWLTQGERVFLQGRAALVALTAVGVGAVIVALRRNTISRTAALTFLVVFTMIDLGTIVGYPWASTENGWNYVDTMRSEAGIVGFLRSQPGDSRVWVNRDDLQVNIGDWEGIEQFNGYTSVPKNVFQAGAFPQVHLLLGERYYISRKPGGPDDKEVYQDSSGIRVYSRSDAQPRVWTVHQSVGVKGREQLFAELGHPLEELKAKAVVTGSAPQLETCAGNDSIRSLEQGQATVVVKLQMACNGMLILTDTFTPGWVGRVDGNPAKIYETYGAVRSIVVPAGEHRVEFRYRPTSVLLGVALTVLGTLILGAMLFASRIHSSEADPPVR
jgi:hypothetical protein